MLNRRLQFFWLTILLSLAVCAQTAAQNSPRLRETKPASKTKLDRKQQFVLDVVTAAVSVPQSDSMDRLRVLAAASSILTPIKPALARNLSAEGLRIEEEAIQMGNTPPTSMIAAGAVQCTGVRMFVENVPSSKIDAAETTLLAAIDRCPRTLQRVQRLITDGLEKGIVAPRLTMAAIDATGSRNEWSRETVKSLFGSLPHPSKERAGEAAEFAMMYSQISRDMPEEIVAQSGLELLSWLGRLSPNKQRNLAVNVATGAMRQRLGDEGYKRTLAADVAALQVAETAGQPGEAEIVREETVSVLKAMDSADVDRTSELERMAPSLRAREAAASGFAAGSDGNSSLAQHYFDIAFQAAEEVWRVRDRQKDATAVVEEVSEAAAQVNSTNALGRAQRLQDPAAQAIAMIAVARVAANR